jgi:hypothetical protein
MTTAWHPMLRSSPMLSTFSCVLAWRAAAMQANTAPSRQISPRRTMGCTPACGVCSPDAVSINTIKNQRVGYTTPQAKVEHVQKYMQ